MIFLLPAATIPVNSPSLILDASALIAAINHEAGGNAVMLRLPHAIMSSVNYSEVATYLVRKGMPIAEASRLLSDFALPVIAFDESQSLRAASLWPKTSAKGLSLGDRACLALALDRGLPILTADRVWTGLKLGITIELFRP